MKNFVKKLLRNKNVLALALAKLLSDILLYNLANFISVLLRFDFVFKPAYFHFEDVIGITENFIFIVFDFIFGLPFQSFSYASVAEVLDIFLAVGISKGLSYLAIYFLKGNLPFSRGAYLVSLFIAFLLIAGIRIIFRIFYRIESKEKPDKRVKNVLIIGAGDAGESLLRQIRSKPELSYDVKGFIDDDPMKKRVRIHGVPVIGPIERLPYVIRDYKIDIVIYAIPSAPREYLQKVVSIVAQTGVQIKTLPPLWEIIAGKVRIEDIKNVELEDLLPRPEIKMDSAVVENYLRGKVVLVTGAGGSIGSEISRQVATYRPKKLILLGRGENRIFDIEQELRYVMHFDNIEPIICDIRDRKRVFKIFESDRPDFVFHAAAHKHVPLMEKNPTEAIINNIFGTKNVLDAACEYNVERFVNISTDKAVNPVNIMGVTKRVNEIMVQLYANDSNVTIFSSVRFGNVLGSKGSVAEVFSMQIKQGIITLTDPNMERYFMLIPEAVELVLHACAMSKGGEIFVLKMGQPMNMLEFAKSFVALSGKELGKDVEIKIIGNRGNEKLKEELWNEKEKVEATNNPYILVIRETSDPKDRDRFFELLEDLREAAIDEDVPLAKSIMKEIVPEYEYSYKKVS